MTVDTAGPELAPPKTDQLNTDLWAKASAYIQKELSEQCYKNWVGPARFLKYESNVLTLELPDKFFADWLRDHYNAIIQEAVFQIAGARPEIQYAIVDRSFKPSSQPLSGGVRKPPQGEPLGLNDRYTFQNFVVGPGNRFAHAAALAVCEAPAKNYNPLFIYGRVGLGKTHLMQAAAHAFLERNPNLKSVYMTGEKFTNQLISAIQNRTTHQFRMRYRTADVLMVDDIHFIAGKESTQEEFFHTFNTLYDAHKQIIVTSDRPPKEIPNLEDRLTSRFAWGLVADIQPPDFETRVAILKKKIEKETVTVPDEVIFFIAEKIKSNIRELEGALMRVMAYTSLTGVAADRRVVEVEVLKDSLKEELGKVSIDQIQKCVSEYFQIKVSELRAKSRSKSVVQPRHVAMYLVRRMTDHSLPEIGGFFGGRGHATVIHACNKVEKELRLGGKTQVVIDQIKMLISKG